MQELINYMKDKKQSFKQDILAVEAQMANAVEDISLLNHRYECLSDKIKLTNEYLSVANAILASSNERE